MYICVYVHMCVYVYGDNNDIMGIWNCFYAYQASVEEAYYFRGQLIPEDVQCHDIFSIGLLKTKSTLYLLKHKLLITQA